jgi:transposase
MDYFAGLDISMDETHVCVLDREGLVVRESKTESTAEAIAGELAKAPSCHRVVFETGRMAPILFHGLNQLGFPVVCVESRQAYQALKSLATHKTDRNDARGLAHLARTGFFKPVHVKSLQAHALRSLISARKKLVGQRVTLENQIRGLAVVFGVRLPRALTTAFIDRALKASEGIAGLSAAMRGLSAARAAVMTAVAAIDADIRRMTRASAACRRLMTIPGVGQLTALAFVAAIDDPSRIRRSRDVGALSGLGSKAISVRGGRLCWQHLEMRGQAGADTPVRSRQRHADPLQGPAQTEGLGLRDRQAINDAKGESRSGAPPRNHHACDAPRWHGVRVRLSPASPATGGRIELPRGATPEGGSRRRRRFCSRAKPLADCDFNRAALHPAYPIKCRTSTQRTQAPESVETQRKLPHLTH